MQDLANKLIALARGNAAARATPSSDSGIRFGLWPILSTEAPGVAMGLMTVLATQLERWPDVLVYRLFVRDDEGEPAQEMSLNQSQFSVDDWQLDNLDENVAVWGELAKKGAGWQLEISVENDLAGDDVATFEVNAPNLASLVEQLPALAAQIAQYVGAGYPRLITLNYSGAVTSTDGAIAGLLEAAFRWERDIFLALWLEDELPLDWDARFETLVTAAQHVDAAFGGWIAAVSLTRALRVERLEIAPIELNDGWTVVGNSLPDNAVVAVSSAWSMLSQDAENMPQAIAVLEGILAASPKDMLVRLALADLYGGANRLNDMIATLQEGIEADMVSAELYFFYAGRLVAMHRSGLAINEFVLTDSPGRQLAGMIDEALEAYSAGLALSPDRNDFLQQRVMLLMEVNDQAAWEEFEQLVAADSAGELIRATVDAFTLLEDITPGLEILSDAAEASPDRADLPVSYAIALMLDERYDEAAESLEKAEDLTDDQAVIAEIERLFLQVNDPDFEVRLGELIALVSAGRPLPARDVKFLEDALEQAQSFSQGYLLLAQSYLNRDSNADALEVLLDGQTYLPEDAEITAQLARLLWESGERDLAFEYLNKGLAHHPDDVSLLALSGQYLFDEGQDEEARGFLMRAQSLDPRNRTLVAVQRYISGQV